MRNLASIQIIENLQPIEGKDRIALATVLGWRVIVQKDEYRIGDKCIYVEVDSQLPEKPEFEFLRSKNFRINTMKMAGVISQGICFPISILPVRSKDYEVGEDVTELMGITKYEPYHDEEPTQSAPSKKNVFTKAKFLMRYKWYGRLVLGKQKKKGGFPSFISKTDETRIQSAPWYLNDQEHPYVATEKIDGTSGTWALVRHRRPLLKDRFEFIVCSRNMRLEEDNSIYWQVAVKYCLCKTLINLIQDNNWVAIQGECIGPKIQGNKYKVSEPHMYAFNLITPKGRVGSLKAKNILANFGINFVPIVDPKFMLPKTVDEMLEYAHGPSAIGDTLREGLVVRSQDGKQSFKAVDPKFLLKYNE